jgi:hypothetical protein
MTQTISSEKIAARDIERLFNMLKKQELDCKLVDLNPKIKDDSEHVPKFVIQGTQLSMNKKRFSFQITIDTEALNKNNKLQTILTLQHLKEEIVVVTPQTTGQLFNLIKLYNYQSVSKKITLASI